MKYFLVAMCLLGLAGCSDGKPGLPKVYLDRQDDGTYCVVVQAATKADESVRPGAVECYLDADDAVILRDQIAVLIGAK